MDLQAREIFVNQLAQLLRFVCKQITEKARKAQRL